MRIESPHAMRNGGWWHPLDVKQAYRPPPPRIEPERPAIDAESMWHEIASRGNTGKLTLLSQILGVSEFALGAIGCAWSQQRSAWCFPMRDETGKVIGIRTRHPDGNKRAITGSRAGPFFPMSLFNPSQTELAITEGASDACAAMDLGYRAIGRSSCLGQEQMLCALIRRLKARSIILIPDNDEPGIRGAMKLSAELSVPHLIWTPPAKDLRAFKEAGGTKQIVESLTRGLVWNQPRPFRTSTTLTVLRSEG